MAAYEEAKGIAPKLGKSGIGVGTWRWLCVKYFTECADYNRLDKRARQVRRLVFEATYNEPIAPGSPNFFRDMPLSKMSADAVEVLRGSEAGVSRSCECAREGNPTGFQIRRSEEVCAIQSSA